MTGRRKGKKEEVEKDLDGFKQTVCRTLESQLLPLLHRGVLEKV